MKKISIIFILLIVFFGKVYAAVPVITGFTATTVSSSQIDLSWGATELPTRYLLYNQETDTYIYDGTNTSFSHTGLSNNTTYNYVVWAYNDSGWSEQADVSATIGSATPPVITVFSGTAVSTSQIDFSWSATNAPTRYLLYNQETDTYIYDGPNTGFSHTGLSNNTTYNYVLWAVNGAGWSSQADISVKTPMVSDTIAPSAITDLRVSNIGNDSVDLTWTASGDDGNIGTASNCEIRYSANDIINESRWSIATQVTGEPIPDIAGSMQTMTISGLEQGNIYYFAIKVLDEVQNISELSNVVTVEFKNISFKEKTKAFPNPYIKGRSSEERINFNNLPKKSTIRIYTLRGELLKTIEHDNFTDGGSEAWDISGIASGIYVYNIISSKEVKKGKISIIK